jgi:SPP1 gp7 family putative phage head morphogenesis protein
MAFTEEQIAKAIAALGVFDPGDYGAMAAFLFPAYEGQREQLTIAYYDTLLQQIRSQYSDDILERAANLAETAADSLLETISTADLNAIGETISRGLDAGLNPRDIARNLQEVQGLDSNRAASFEKFREGLAQSDMTDAQIAAAEEREFQRLLKDRRETIANTEANRAVSAGDMLEAKNTGARFKVWQTTGDERVSEECQANEAQGPIPIDDDFDGGVAAPPQHPNCRCSVSYVDDEEQLPFFEEGAAARAERTAAAKEKD